MGHQAIALHFSHAQATFARPTLHGLPREHGYLQHRTQAGLEPDYEVSDHREEEHEAGCAFCAYAARARGSHPGAPRLTGPRARE